MDISPFITGSAPYLTAFLAGLLGGVHCLGMCGGITGALVHGLAPEHRRSAAALLPFVLAYNTGRILTYTMAGAAVGLLGYLAGDLLAEYRAWFYMRILAAGFMIALGLYLAGWWPGLARIERAGGIIWARVQPLSRRLLPVRTVPGAMALGLAWGWLPCGLVYTTLVWSLAAGGWREGAQFMLAFGLGTMPTLITAGFATAALGGLVRRRGVRQAAGLLVIAFGAWTLAATQHGGINVGLGCLPPG